MALADLRTERTQRRVRIGPGQAAVEVRGLADEHNDRVLSALEKRLNRLGGIDWWRVNAVTGRVVAGLSDAEEQVPELLDAVAEVEAEAAVEDQGWDRSVEHPSDREPVLAAGIELAADVIAVSLAAGGSLIPFGGPLRWLRGIGVLIDNQPRLRGQLESMFGRTRTDVVLTLVTAVGAAAGENVAKLAVDSVQRGFTLLEAASTYARWQSWETETATGGQPVVRDPLPERPRPVALPPGPVEKVADETAAGSLVGAAALTTGGRSADAIDALELSAPKAARAGREAYAATVSALLARAGVLTMHPQLWRVLDRVSALVIDGEVLLTDRRVVLAVEPARGRTAAHVWAAAQRVLPHGGTAPGASDDAGNRLRLVHPGSGTPDRGGTRRPVWRELRAGDRVLGRVLIGREPDRRAQAVLDAARAAGVRVIVSAHQDLHELRSLADEFVSGDSSCSKLVDRLQRDGHVVAVLGARAFKALDWADAAIGVARADHGELRVPWTADVICRDLVQVQRILGLIGPARQVSDRARTLALSGSALGGLLLVARPAARSGSASAPLLGATVAALVNGAAAGWHAVRAEPAGALAPLLPWHALEAAEVLDRLPAVPPAERPGTRSRRRALPFARLEAALDFAVQLRHELADPLTPVLGVGAAATAILGSPSDALLLSSVLAVNAVVSARQRQRAERALHTMIEREQSIARLVDRAHAGDARPPARRVPADLLAIGDIIALRPGDVVPADARLLHTDDLEMDESGLTGESVTVEKRTAPTPGAALAERTCMVFEGATVVNGEGTAVVVATGDETQAGRAAAGAQPPEKGGVQAQLRELTDRALPLTLSGGSVVALLGALRGRALPQAVADGVAVAVAAVPEGLPLVATVAQLAAARRLSRYGVLVRASRTVEALGRVDTLCFDKTGTLTAGRLQLTAVADLDRQWPLRDEPGAEAEDVHRLLRAAARACPDPADGPAHHATDRAVIEAAATHLDTETHRWDPIEEVPFESNRGYAAAVGNTERRLRLFVKGAPEVVLPRCAKVRDRDGAVRGLGAGDRKSAERTVHRLAEQGLRVLAVARRDLSTAPEDVESAVGELTLLGFIGLADPPRAHSLRLVKALRDNGIDVRMITGDHPVTAAAIARQLGLAVERVTTGADLDRLDESGRAELIERSAVFARVNPEHKVRIVAALRGKGHVVGMTGDGSNDAAAIRTADVGIGLAAQGSVAARNAADLVLTEPDPLALLDTLVEGRGMWRRVTDAVGVLVGGNAGEIGFTLYGTAISGHAPLGTRQFLLVNMLTDMFPALALALSGSDGGEDDSAADIEDRADHRAAQLSVIPPARLGADLARTLAVRGIATAAGASVAWTLGRYTGTRRRAATIGLVALIGTQLGQTLLAGRGSPIIWATTLASTAALAGVVMTPGVCTYFGCRPLGPAGWLIALGSAAGATAGSLWLPALLPNPGN